MSVRGSVIVECDSPTCHAEQVYTGEQVLETDIYVLLATEGWRVTSEHQVCPQCVQAQP